jgi:ribonuclease BN (tRNA processing enzyme)
VEVTIIGTKSGMPTPGQPSSGYLVSDSGASILLDCGPGTASALAGSTSLSAVFISHLHGDHCYDLLPLARLLLSPRLPYPAAGVVPEPAEPIERIPLYVPRGGAAPLRTLQGLFPVRSSPWLDRAIDAMFDIREYDGDSAFSLGPFEVSVVPLRHVVENCGVRLTANGECLAYTGDTGWTTRLLELADDVDLLLAEATLREHDDGPHGHLAAFETGELATLAKAAKVVLTHFSQTDPEWKASLAADARSRFDGEIVLAAPGLSLAVR